MTDSKKNLLYFMFLSLFTWSGVPLLYSFIPTYYSGIGFDGYQIGLLTSLGPLCCILVQPFIGVRADRARYKNTILNILLIGCMVSILLTVLYRNFYYVLVAAALLAISQSAMTSLSETITLEYVTATDGNYGIIRLFGSLGFAVFAFILGFLVKQDNRAMFYMTALITFFCILVLRKIPKVKGHQSEGHRVSFLKLFESPKIPLYILFHMIIQITLSYNSSFFPIYLKQLGGSESLLGLSLFITAGSELPFLFFANKIVARFGVKKLLLTSTLLMAIRMLLMGFVPNPVFLVGLSVIHGGIFIVFTYCLAVLISNEAPKELRATGQTFNSLMAMGIGRMLGSLLGGVSSEAFGLQHTYYLAGGLNILSFIVFGFIFLKMRSRTPLMAPEDTSNP